MSGIGHNGSPPDDETNPFDRDAAAVKAKRDEVALNRLQAAIRDPALDRGHLRVLANITEHTNRKTGLAWMSRRHIAEAEGLEHKQVHNKLYTLRVRGYLDWGQRPHADTGRRLTHYVLPVRRYPRELLAEMIEAALPGVREMIEQKSALQGMHSHSESARPTVHFSEGDCTPGSALGNEKCTPGNVEKCTPGNVHVNKEEKGRRGQSPREAEARLNGQAYPPADGKSASHPFRGELNGKPHPQGDGGKRHLMTEAEQTAALNPAGPAAFLYRNLKQTISGMIDVGDEYRAEMRRRGFTDSQIDRGVQRGPAALEKIDLTTSNGLGKLSRAIEKYASYAKGDDEKAAKAATKNSKGVFR
jgi:hypothetical protein